MKTIVIPNAVLRLHKQVILQQYTVHCCYNTGQFSPNYSQETSHRLPVRVRYGEYWRVQALINVQPWSLQWWMHYHVLFARVITALHCMWATEIGSFDLIVLICPLRYDLPWTCITKVRLLDGNPCSTARSLSRMAIVEECLSKCMWSNDVFICWFTWRSLKGFIVFFRYMGVDLGRVVNSLGGIIILWVSMNWSHVSCWIDLLMVSRWSETWRDKELFAFDIKVNVRKDILCFIWKKCYRNLL